VRPRFSLLIAMLLSSVLFSLAHYFVIFDEPFVLTIAGYRVLEGLLFATIYVSRGFAIAVYAHAFYDLMAYFVYA
jgi:membrane protease YdiL (CAAX protease family)